MHLGEQARQRDCNPDPWRSLPTETRRERRGEIQRASDDFDRLENIIHLHRLKFPRNGLPSLALFLHLL